MINKRVPELRFPEFHGEWGTSTIKNLGILVIDGDRGEQYPSSNEIFEDEFCLFLNAKNVTANGFLFKDVQFITRDKDKLLGKGKLKRDDIVLTTRGTVGNFAYYDSSIVFEHVRINSGMVILRNNSETINSKYLYKYSNSKQVIFQIKTIAFGSAQPQLTVLEINKFTIHYPTLPEQTKIADFLTAIDDKIQQFTKKKQLIEQYKKGLMQQIFSQKIRFKDDNGNEYPEWEKKQLKAICAIKKGEQLSLVDMSENGEYPVLNGGIRHSGYTNDYNNDGATITISEGGNSCGFVNFLNCKFWAGGHCYTLFNVISGKEYLYQVLKYSEEVIMKLRVGSGLPNIQKLALENFVVILPTNISEQTKIADFLSAIDDKITQITAQLKQTQLFKKSLLQQMLI